MGRTVGRLLDEAGENTALHTKDKRHRYGATCIFVQGWTAGDLRVIGRLRVGLFITWLWIATATSMHGASTIMDSWVTEGRNIA